MTHGLVRRFAAGAFGLSVALCPGTVLAQANLGELLDAGAKRLSGREFNDEIAGRSIVGPLPTGGDLEVLYTPGGRVVGRGTSPSYQAPTHRPIIDGNWRIDEGERVCVTMTFGSQTFPTRCQYWFKLAETYYLSDSDSDRRAKILRRAVKN